MKHLVLGYISTRSQHRLSQERGAATAIADAGSPIKRKKKKIAQKQNLIKKKLKKAIKQTKAKAQKSLGESKSSRSSS